MRRVLLLMLPVTISLGLINFNLLINSFFGSLVDDRGPAAIDKAFRDLPAAAGDLLRRDRDRPLPDPGPVRGAWRAGRPARDDGERDAPDRLRAAPRSGRGARPLRADDPADLPARRVHRGSDRPGRDRALLVRLLAADQRPLPAAHQDLLQPAAALAPDADRGRQPGRSRHSPRCFSTSRSGSAESSPRPRSRRRAASSPSASCCAASSAASSCAASPTRPCGWRSPRRPSPRSASPSGTCLDAALGRARRPGRLPRDSARGRRRRLPRRGAGAAGGRAGADHAPRAARRLELGVLGRGTPRRGGGCCCSPAGPASERHGSAPASCPAGAGRPPGSPPPCWPSRCCSGPPSCSGTVGLFEPLPYLAAVLLGGGRGR